MQALGIYRHKEISTSFCIQVVYTVIIPNSTEKVPTKCNIKKSIRSRVKFRKYLSKEDEIFRRTKSFNEGGLTEYACRIIHLK